jgi:hypothetical protein
VGGSALTYLVKRYAAHQEVLIKKIGKSASPQKSKIGKMLVNFMYRTKNLMASNNQPVYRLNSVLSGLNLSSAVIVRQCVCFLSAKALTHCSTQIFPRLTNSSLAATNIQSESFPLLKKWLCLTVIFTITHCFGHLCPQTDFN